MSGNQNKRSSLMEDLENRFTLWFVELPEANRKTLTVVLSVATIVLAAASSLIVIFFPSIEKTPILNWVPVLIGFPAGLTAFTVLYILVEIYKGKISEYKEKVLYRKRIQHMLILSAVSLPMLIILSSIGMPYGLGGVLIIVLFLVIVDLVRRTDIEYEYYVNGQIDPREIQQEL